MKRINRRTGGAARWTALAAVAAVLLAVPVVAQMQFSDVPDDNPHRADIDAVAGRGWFVGYGDGTYKPDQKISPSEMTRVLTRAFDEGLTRAEFASFMVAGSEWQSRVQETLPIIWDTYSPGKPHFVRSEVLYLVGYHDENTWWRDDDGSFYIEPGEYQITDGDCRWMRLGQIPEGGQDFDTIAATDIPLAENFRTERTRESHNITIRPDDAAFMIDCGY